MESKLESYLGLSRKAGYLIIGGEKLEDYTKKLYLVLYDSSAQKNTMKVVEKLKERNVPVIKVDGLGQLIKIDSCKIVGNKNKNLSDIIINLLK